MPGVLMATPLFLVLLVVESTDLVFAVDSIPAVLAVTQNPFLVYTSNVFAILGLRALYFLLAGAMAKFHYLKLALSLILGFVGVKMLIADFYKIPITLSLGVIAGLLTIAVVASLMRARRLGDAANPAVEQSAPVGVIVRWPDVFSTRSTMHLRPGPNHPNRGIHRPVRDRVRRIGAVLRLLPARRQPAADCRAAGLAGQARDRHAADHLARRGNPGR